MLTFYCSVYDPDALGTNAELGKVRVRVKLVRSHHDVNLQLSDGYFRIAMPFFIVFRDVWFPISPHVCISMYTTQICSHTGLL